MYQHTILDLGQTFIAENNFSLGSQCPLLLGALSIHFSLVAFYDTLASLSVESSKNLIALSQIFAFVLGALFQRNPSSYHLYQESRQ